MRIVVVVVVEARPSQGLVGRFRFVESGDETGELRKGHVGKRCHVVRLDGVLLTGRLAAGCANVVQGRDALARADAGKARLAARDRRLQRQLRRQPKRHCLVVRHHPRLIVGDNDAVGAPIDAVGAGRQREGPARSGESQLALHLGDDAGDIAAALGLGLIEPLRKAPEAR